MNTLNGLDVSWLVLENVDIDESPDSNLTLIMEALAEAGAQGFHVHACSVLASDFGVPQRRTRLFIVGASKAHYPSFDTKRIEKFLSEFKLKCQPPEACRHKLQ